MDKNENRCVVTVKKDVDVDALMEELCSIGSTTPYVPHRKVEMWNEKNDSLRNFDVVLTKEEAEELRKDPRVVDVRVGSKDENGYFFKPTTLDSLRIYDRSFTQNSNHYPWSIPACINQSNPFSTTSLNYQHPYTAIGDGVDVVIQDSGIEIGHPEWLSLDGSVSRLKTVNWPAVSGFSGIYTQGPLHYTDTYGHGTHCAGSAAGRRYGWAKGSDIYAIKIFDNDAFGISASFNMIRGWHNLKTNGRPTVVNMSWGYFSIYSGIIGGSYRGTPWVGNTAQSAFGMIETIFNDETETFGGYSHPIRIASVDADIEDCIDAGIVLVAAAGNDAHKMDVLGGLDYDNYYSTNTQTRYYHRGSTPNGPSGVITVGSVSASNLEFKSPFSNCGPGITVYAPGEAIQSAMPNGADLASNSVPYPGSSSFLSKKISGTSMAAPQVAGVLACLIGNRKHYNSKNCVDWLKSSATVNRMSDAGGISYTNLQNLQGPNRYLRWPFNSTNPLIVNRT